jgi:hypothetical protein
MNRSPLHDLHLELGAVLREEDGWEVVGCYGDARTGALVIREGAGVCDLTHRGWLRVAGADRIRFLQAMFTNDVAGRAPGQGTYGAFLNDRGRVVSDAALLVMEDAVYLDVEAPARETLPPVLDRYIIMDDVSVTDETPGRVLLTVQGPTSSGAVAQAVGDVSDLAELEHRRIGGVLVIRHDRAGETGYDLCTPPGEAARLLDALRESGALPAGVEALEICRIEAGLPRAFVDMDETTIFLEAGGERSISRSKGCYLGQEVIVRALDRGGVKRQLRGLRISGAQAPARGAKVHLGDREVGHVTSACLATAGLPIALALLHRDAWEPGTDVSVDGLPATVAALPFYRRA